MEFEKVLKAKNGDEQAVDEIVNAFRPLIKSVARGYFLIGGDLDDLMQEGMIGLFKAINGFDPEKSAEFKPFALMCVNREILNCIKKNNTDKNKALNNAVPFDSLNENALKNASPLNIVIDREENVVLLNLIENHLSKLEKQVVLMYFKGFDYGEISKELNISVRSASNALQRAKTKLHKVLQR